MSFNKTDKTFDDYLVDTHTEYVNVWNAVHDELDFFVPKVLRDPIMKQVVNVSSLKDLFDKFKLPGLALSFDIEHDKWGSWTSLDSTDIYNYPLHVGEHNFEDNIKKVNISKSPEIEKIVVNFSDVSEDWLIKLSKLKSGSHQIIVTDGSNSFQYNRLVDYSL